MEHKDEGNQIKKGVQTGNIRKTILLVLGDEKRQKITIPLFAIALSLLLGALLIIGLGKNPITAYQNLLQGSGLLPKMKYAGGKSMMTDFTSFLSAWTPMVFASLSVAVALKAGLFNIGVAGQMLTAGFVGSVVVGYAELSPMIAKPMALFVGMLAGAFVGGLIGFLKYRFHINEVVSSIMTNYIAQYLISFFINTKYLDHVSRQSLAISDASRWTLMNTPVGDLKMDIPLGVFVAVLVSVLIYILFEKTTFGYEIRSIGSNTKASRYAGMNVGKNMILSMLISGGLAGMAGIMQYMGHVASIQPRVLPTVGFDSVAVSLLASNHAIGVLFSSFLITILSKGSVYMSSTSGIEPEIASVITGIILLFSACNIFIQSKVRSWEQEIEKEQGEE